MTLQQVIDEIQLWIVANGNQEITANVLRPILENMVTQPNDLIGDLSALSTTDKDSLVEAINEVITLINNDGLTIHTGTTEPNVIPPASYELGDFYKYLVDGVMTAFYIYNGLEWVRLVNVAYHLTKTIIRTSDSYLVKPEDYVVIYDGVIANNVVLPLADDGFRRVIKVINRSLTGVVTLNVTYLKANGDTSNEVAIGEIVELHSDGVNWYKTN